MNARIVSLAIGAVVLASGCCRPTRCETTGLPILARGSLAPTSKAQIFLEGHVLRTAGAGSERTGSRVISETETRALLTSSTSVPAGTFLAVPEVVTLDGQDSSIFVGEFPESSLSVRDPLHSDRFDAPGVHGMGLWVTPRIDGDRVTLDVRLAWKDEAVAEGGRANRLSANATLGPGQTLVAEAPLDASDPRAPGRLVLILTPKVIRPAPSVAAK